MYQKPNDRLKGQTAIVTGAIHAYGHGLANPRVGAGDGRFFPLKVRSRRPFVTFCSGRSYVETSKKSA